MRLLLNLELQFLRVKNRKGNTEKRQDARKKGQVVKSQDISSAIVMLMVFIFCFSLQALCVMSY